MDNFVSSLIASLYEAFIERIGCTVARIVFPLLSLGRIQVKPRNSSPQRFNWFGYRLDEINRIELEEPLAGILGLFLVFIVLLAIARLVSAFFPIFAWTG